MNRSSTLPDALMVIDVQNDFCHPEGAMAQRGVDTSGSPAIAEVTERLCSAFRAADRPVIFVRTEHGPWTDSPAWMQRLEESRLGGKEDVPPICAEGSWGSQFFTLAPAPEDRVITKRRYSAFFGTDLETVLHARRVHSVAITGVATNVCVEATARDAFMRDYDTVVISEACGAYTLEEHNTSLRNINTYFGRVVSADELLPILARERA